MALTNLDQNYIKKFIGTLLMGFATGIKINFIFFGIFYYLYTWFTALKQTKPKRSNFIKESITFAFKKEKLGVFYIIGFILGSPSMLWEPKTYLENLLKHTHPKIEWQNLSYLYQNSVGTFWETVILPSLPWFSLCAPAFILLLALIAFKKIKITDKKFLYALIVTVGLFLYAFLKAKLYFSWYSYPIIILFLFWVCTLNIPRAALTVIVAINILFNGPVIFAQITNKTIHINNTYIKEQHENFINAIKQDFIKKHPTAEAIISLNPAEGSGILTIQEHLKSQTNFEKPTLIAVSKIMLIGNNENIYSHIAETFNAKKIKRFDDALTALSLKNKSNLKYEGSYKDLFVFTYVPNHINTP